MLVLGLGLGPWPILKANAFMHQVLGLAIQVLGLGLECLV